MENIKKKIVFIIPYYGELPVSYKQWEMTAKLNTGFDFLLVSDIPGLESTGNIHVLNMSFSKLRELFQNKFDFKICLNQPYKLCDYKPAYGYLFSDYIQEYSFWGHCDMDVLFGNLSEFLTDEIFSAYDKIFELGHMTIYRNTFENNTRFMSIGSYPEYNYREVYSSHESFWFDEFYGMMLKSRRLGTTTYLNQRAYVDLDTSILPFRDVGDDLETETLIFEWNAGKLYAHGKDSCICREIGYVHLQKRDLTYLKEQVFSHDTRFFIIPNEICRTLVEAKTIKFRKFDKLQYTTKRKFLHLIDFFRRYSKAKVYYKDIFEYYKSRQQLKKRRNRANKIICDMKGKINLE